MSRARHLPSAEGESPEKERRGDGEEKESKISFSVSVDFHGDSPENHRKFFEDSISCIFFTFFVFARIYTIA